MTTDRLTVLVLATANPNKVAELGELLETLPMPIEVRARPEWLEEVDETGTTFAANADLKAVAVATSVGHWALADDSGLEVDALDGAPGVRSARFAADLAERANAEGNLVADPMSAGETTSIDEANRRALSAELTGLGGDGRRSARFRCALSLADPSGIVGFRAEGVVEGRVITQARGDGGFGYDPIFVPDDGNGLTFAEMSRSAKAAMSHRGRALSELIAGLRSAGWPLRG